MKTPAIPAQQKYEKPKEPKTEGVRGKERGFLSIIPFNRSYPIFGTGIWLCLARMFHHLQYALPDWNRVIGCSEFRWNDLLSWGGIKRMFS